jgi:single-stranded DNA-binding protein
MSHVHKVIFIGHASQYSFGETSSGKTYCSFKLFIVDKFGDKETKNYFNVVCYAGIAELLKRYPEENKHIYVEGRIKTFKDYNDNDKFDIVADTIRFI